MKNKIIWHKVLNNKNELVENRVMTVNAGHTQVCLTHFNDTFTATVGILIPVAAVQMILTMGSKPTS